MVLNSTVFDGAISYLMVLQVRMVLRKEEFFLRGFLMDIDDLSIALSNSKYGCTFGGCSVNHLSYADDMLILSPSATALQKLQHPSYTTTLRITLVWSYERGWSFARDFTIFRNTRIGPTYGNA